MEFVPIIKPVGSRCNSSCSYCYFLQKDRGQNNTATMNNDVLKEFIDNICQNQKTVEFIWHGGEPLMAGIDFYSQVINFQSKWAVNGWKIYNSIQTNGTLINEEWVNFFAKNNFGVGVSLDGPVEFHNKVRKMRDGTNSFEKIVKNIDFLKEAKILTNVICCVSQVNVKFPEDIFDFFARHDIKQLKFLHVQGRDKKGKLLPYSIGSYQYAEFLMKIFQKWIEIDDPEIEIREINSIVNLLLGGNFRECIFGGECHKYLTIYPDGSIYGCDSLPQIDSLCFGNATDVLRQVEVSSNFLQFQNKLERLRKKCAACEWFNICRGGCPQDWWPDILNDSASNYFCDGLKIIFATIQKTLKAYHTI